jgi:hypothetical protein
VVDNLTYYFKHEWRIQKKVSCPENFYSFLPNVGKAIPNYRSSFKDKSGLLLAFRDE